jgi:hypothetical protein
MYTKRKKSGLDKSHKEGVESYMSENTESISPYTPIRSSTASKRIRTQNSFELNPSISNNKQIISKENNISLKEPEHAKVRKRVEYHKT